MNRTNRPKQTKKSKNQKIKKGRRKNNKTFRGGAAGGGGPDRVNSNDPVDPALSMNQMDRHQMILVEAETKRAHSAGISWRQNDYIDLFQRVGLLRPEDGRDAFRMLFTAPNRRYPYGRLRYNLESIIKDFITIKDAHQIELAKNRFSALEEFIRGYYYKHDIIFERGFHDSLKIQGVTYDISRNEEDLDTLITGIRRGLQENIKKYENSINHTNNNVTG